ncbi:MULTISPECIES: hypothetical protein [Cyanophyceae]|uniref:hypothetical protein n=1 Tax=Cyanophyceae TaxID=3028117 RepID=UPI001686ED5D|nr:hypothetical protein [Trichocoleus sp. FACHB-40]MBD2006510.1 hypothetical protein [Trichocoleus sp. FACHB-40]
MFNPQFPIPNPQLPIFPDCKPPTAAGGLAAAGAEAARQRGSRCLRRSQIRRRLAAELHASERPVRTHGARTISEASRLSLVLGN